MKTIYMMFVVIILITLQTSCLSKRAITSQTLTPDYNQRITVSEAFFKKRLAPIGLVVSIGMGGGGAIGANEAKITKHYNDQNQPTTNTPANYVIGGLSGFGVSFLLHDVGGLGKQRTIKSKSDRSNWIHKRIGNPSNYIIVNTKQLEVFTLVKKTAQSSWIVKDMQDVEDFLLVFSEADGASMMNVAKQALDVLATDVNTTMQIRKMFEKTLAKDYVNEQAGNKAAKQVNDYRSLIEFTKQYPLHSKLSELISKVTPQASRTELKAMIGLFLGLGNTVEAKKRYINTAQNLSDYLEAINFADPQNQYFSVTATQDKAFSLIKGFDDAIRFKNKFPTSKYIHTYSERTFIGTLQNGERSGKGIMLYGNGEYYDGYWANDLKNGYGTYKNSAFVYMGYFKDGKYEGEGKLEKKDGEIYEGNFRNDLYHGKGTWVCPDKSVKNYTGNFKNGKPDGFGTMVYTHGAKYEGGFSEGKKHGEGTLSVWENGEMMARVYKGTFENGLEQGSFSLKQSKGILGGLWLEVYITYENGEEISRYDWINYNKYPCSGNESSEEECKQRRQEANARYEAERYEREAKDASDKATKEAEKQQKNAKSKDYDDSKEMYDAVIVPSYKMEGWKDDVEMLWGKYKKNYINFDDNYGGTIFFGYKSGKYFLSGGLGTIDYYKDFNSVIKALYIYEKYWKMTKHNRD